MATMGHVNPNLGHFMMTLFNATAARTLFDTRASHCFVSKRFLTQSGLTTIPDGTDLNLATAIGAKQLPTMRINGRLTIEKCWFQISCIMVDFDNFDMLGMSWMNKHKAIINHRRIYG